MKKEQKVFGRYVVTQYFCIRFRERNADELKYWNKDEAWASTLKKNFFEKTSKKFW